MFQYSTIEEAILAMQQGKMIMVTDDEDRENEGDLICAAEFATTENINFMATHAKGLICMPMSREVAQKLELSQMVEQNTDNHATAFTVSIDHVETTTGISAVERGLTARKAASPDAKPSGSYVPAGSKGWRCVGSHRSHRGYRGFVPLGRTGTGGHLL